KAASTTISSPSDTHFSKGLPTPKPTSGCPSTAAAISSITTLVHSTINALVQNPTENYFNDLKEILQIGKSMIDEQTAKTRCVQCEAEGLDKRVEKRMISPGAEGEAKRPRI